MKIQIHNFGPIDFFECDLDKDLHLIVGENNIGKSYAITTIYLMLKALKDAASVNFRINAPDDLSFEKTMGISNLKVGEEIDITQSFCHSLTQLLEITVVARFQRYLEGTYNSIDSITNIFTENKLSIILQFDNVNIEFGISKNVFKIKKININQSIKVRAIKQKRSYVEKTDSIIIYHNYNNHEHFNDNFLSAVFNFHNNLMNNSARKIKSIHYLPASRSGLYQALTAFGQIIAELSKSRSFINEKIELPAISVPLSDYFLELSKIEVNKQNYENNPINKVAEEIENAILQGKVEFDSQSKKLFYTPNDSDLKLDIRSTSSMVSEISPIIAFLRHILTKTHRQLSEEKQNSKQSAGKSLIFIEEPEAHLHPINQIKLMKAFAELLNCNVKLILTSHSNYIFNKLNNLILEKSVDIDRIEATILKQSPSGSKASLLELDELGIEDENFLDVAEQLYEEKLALIDRLNSDV